MTAVILVYKTDNNWLDMRRLLLFTSVWHQDLLFTENFSHKSATIFIANCICANVRLENLTDEAMVTLGGGRLGVSVLGSIKSKKVYFV